MKEIKLVQNTPEWLDFRLKHIGSSESSIVLDINPWTSAIDMWEEKVGLSKLVADNDAMRAGRELEPVARAWYENLKGESFQPIVAEHDTITYLSASLDGISLDRKRAVEIKCGVRSFEMAKQGVIPDYYMCQCQHIYLVTGCESLDYVAFDPKKVVHPIVIHVERDPSFEKMALSEYSEFWHCVDNFVSPNVKVKEYKSV
jgi:putative phage-type endonuclease